MIQTLCRDRWDKGNSFHRHPQPWSLSELSSTLGNTLEMDQWPSRFCFFIDGLDEYVGTANEQYSMVRDLERLAQCPYVKVCVSSRPWNVFRSAYWNHADRKVVLQDHNAKDLDKFIRGKLEGDSRYLHLAAEDEKAKDFALEIRLVDIALYG